MRGLDARVARLAGMEVMGTGSCVLGGWLECARPRIGSWPGPVANAGDGDGRIRPVTKVFGRTSF